MRRALVFASVLVGLISSCAYYPNLDYVRYRGVEYDPKKGYHTWEGRQTSKADRIFSFAIGQKKFREFNSDHDLASKTITRQIFEKEGYCPNGYDIVYDKYTTGGDHSFIWKAFCR